MILNRDSGLLHVYQYESRNISSAILHNLTCEYCGNWSKIFLVQEFYYSTPFALYCYLSYSFQTEKLKKGHSELVFPTVGFNKGLEAYCCSILKAMANMLTPMERWSVSREKNWEAGYQQMWICNFTMCQRLWSCEGPPKLLILSVTMADWFTAVQQ